MGREVDAEYAWWMEQLQDAVDEETRLLACGASDQVDAIRHRIAIIKYRIEELLHREMEQAPRP